MIGRKKKESITLMKNRLVFNSRIAKLIDWILSKLTGTGIAGVVIFKTAYFPRSREDTSEATIIHEKTHIRQQMEDGIKFYFRYYYELIYYLIKYRSYWEAHRNISYEIEAFEEAGQI